MGHYKIVKGKSTARTLARLVVSHQVTGPVSMELVKDLGPSRIWDRTAGANPFPPDWCPLVW